MMKNKLFIPLLVFMMGLGLVACQPEVDVLGINKDISKQTLLGTDSARSVCYVSGTTMRIVEYKFLPGDKAVRTDCTFGDGLQESESKNLSYVMEFLDNKYGMNLTFTPETEGEEPYNVSFIGNVLIEPSGDTIIDLISRVDKLNKILPDLANSKWTYIDSALWVNIIPVFDSIKIDTVLKPVIGIVNGKPGVVRVDTVFTPDSIFRDSIDVIGLKRYERIEMSFNRDENTLANTGHYSYFYEEFTKDLVKVDSVCTYIDKDYRWGIYDVTRHNRFGIRTISDDANKEVVDYAISVFMDPIKDADKNTIGYSMKVDGTNVFNKK